jgi:hypothetical protein
MAEISTANLPSFADFHSLVCSDNTVTCFNVAAIVIKYIKEQPQSSVWFYSSEGVKTSEIYGKMTI